MTQKKILHAYKINQITVQILLFGHLLIFIYIYLQYLFLTL
jgi:hypothetical protein